jgi:hypothetical protein
MGLKATFFKAVESVFKVFKEAVKKAEYVVTEDNGFDDPIETRYSARVILDKFSQEDMEALSFSNLVQPTDTKGLVPGKDLSVEMKTVNTLDVEGRTFTIVGWETDPYGALYTLLLRDIK